MLEFIYIICLNSFIFGGRIMAKKKKCTFKRTSSHALKIARERKKEINGKGLSWKERYDRRKKAIKEFEKWWK